jgi:hypothetical protein
MAAPAAVARWSAWDGSGLDECRLALAAAGPELKGEVAAEPGERPWCRYAVSCDREWRTRAVSVDLMDGRRLRLGCDGAGGWTRDGQPAPDLAGAIDVDLSGTPATNTLPIRRLGLGIGDRARIAVAYVDLPALAVRLEAQRYTRLSEARYHFESAAHGFARDVEVDADGLVVSYPGLFRRVG